jgi:thiamine biosynthesis protein ThiI
MAAMGQGSGRDGDGAAALAGAEELLLGRCAEIALKGGNRPDFERALLRRAREVLPAGCRTRMAGGRLEVRLPAALPPEPALAALGRCFGLVAVQRAFRLPRPHTPEELAAACVRVADAASSSGARSFKIAARRADKGYPLTSLELNRMLGAAVATATGLRVDVHRPDLTLGVDARADGVYLTGEVCPGPGGLPTGTAGRALLLLSGGIDSPVAGYLAAKRGLRLSAVYFHTFPYTGDGARAKAVDLARRLAAFAGPVRLWIGGFTPVQLAIQRAVPEPLRTLVVRRLMLRVAEELARRERAGALITGDSLGQVASQTLEALAAVGEVAQLPLLRPLVAMDKTEIIALARRIGTYEVSIRPFDDCCTLFAPRHPRTRPTRAEVRAAEASLDVAALVAAAVAASERLRVAESGVSPDPPGGAGPVASPSTADPADG